MLSAPTMACAKLGVNPFIVAHPLSQPVRADSSPEVEPRALRAVSFNDLTFAQITQTR